MGFKRKEENITVFGKRRSIARQGVLQGTGGSAMVYLKAPYVKRICSIDLRAICRNVN